MRTRHKFWWQILGAFLSGPFWATLIVGYTFIFTALISTARLLNIWPHQLENLQPFIELGDFAINIPLLPLLVILFLFGFGIDLVLTTYHWYPERSRMAKNMILPFVFFAFVHVALSIIRDTLHSPDGSYADAFFWNNIANAAIWIFVVAVAGFFIASIRDVCHKEKPPKIEKS